MVADLARVSLQVPAYREPELTGTLDAIADQPVPDGVAVSYECWVTPAPNGQTMEQAEAHDTFRAYEAPEGKLTTRNVAHDAAFQGGADAVVVWDADAPPLAEDVLPKMLEPLNQPQVVGTMARPRSPPSVTGMAVNLVQDGLHAVHPYMHGQCSAVTWRGWHNAGPFETDFEAGASSRVWLHEEVGFYRRLARVGDVVRVRDAPVFNDMRRWDCRVREFPGVESDPYCDRISGDTTFQPDDHE